MTKTLDVKIDKSFNNSCIKSLKFISLPIEVEYSGNYEQKISPISYEIGNLGLEKVGLLKDFFYINSEKSLVSYKIITDGLRSPKDFEHGQIEESINSIISNNNLICQDCMKGINKHEI